ncbi:M23 family metallopeptidase [Methylobacterium oryzihabitans]|uniref:M23 family metallopeptidase n=1 Tax=Methylobacterium oryzihabitans TaxID=2499852 RepID=A0A437NWT1_9HYPH|nr:M23 family metallopeptidase [Methylobacterium oryzihabitans]RVU14466.1 M23 family metallopeptidase [Methylobacterium oryzihabitans]
MRRIARLPGLLAVLALAPAARAQTISLALPLACTPGRTCFVQHYVDHDPSSGARDHACGPRTYDGHDGTDFRLTTRPEAARGPGTVLAAADGRVLRTRNDAPDVSVRETGRGAVAGVECGNGLVIAHADGDETQYCHLAKGSLRVRPGDRVAAGQPLGQVGLSGATEFPHLHFTLRRNGRTIDPFAPGLAAGSCTAAASLDGSLWNEAARRALAYRAGTVLNAGFAPGPVTMEAVEGEAVGAVPRDPDALVAWIRAIGLDTGDVQRLSLAGPDGRVIAEREEPALARPRAQSLLFAGRKRPAGGWPPGTYAATFAVRRGGADALTHRFTLTLP